MSSITPKPGMTVEISMQGIEKSRLDAIEAAESLRKANEAKRTEAETARANAEALRQQTFEANEANRQTAYESAESARESEWTEIKSNVETSVGSAVASASAATDAANTAADNANAAAEKSVRYDVAQKISDAQKAQARGNIDAADKESVDALKGDLAAITPDDNAVDGKPWTSEKIVEALCPPFETTGSIVQCHPVEHYPLGVVSRIDATQSGTGDASPDNIRPIVGWDSVSVTRCGKNLFSVGSANIFINNSGQETPIVGSVTTHKIPCKAGDKFILTCKNTFAPAPGNIGVVAFYDASDALLQRISNTHTNNITSTAPENAYYVLASCYAPTEADEIVFELGSTATPYEPYTGDTYTAELPETIYGGELDWNTGVLTVDRRITIADGTVNKFTPDHMGTFWNMPFKSAPGTIDVMGVQNSHFKKDKFGLNGNNDFLFTMPEYMNGLFDTADNLNAYLVEQNASGTPVIFVYKLKTPYTVQLTPQQIAALSGVNTLYTDSGDISVSGRTDMIWLTQSLIDRIAALETAAVSE